MNYFTILINIHRHNYMHHSLIYKPSQTKADNKNLKFKYTGLLQTIILQTRRKKKLSETLRF